MTWLRVKDAPTSPLAGERSWQRPPGPLAPGTAVEVLALPPSLVGTDVGRGLLGRVGTVVQVHDYDASGWADALGHDVLYDVQVPGYVAFPFARHELRRRVDDDRLPLVQAESHPIGSMDPTDPERFRLSAAAERRASKAWLSAAVHATSQPEVLACTQLGRAALRQAHEYGLLADELVASR